MLFYILLCSCLLRSAEGGREQCGKKDLKQVFSHSRLAKLIPDETEVSGALQTVETSTSSNESLLNTFDEVEVSEKIQGIRPHSAPPAVLTNIKPHLGSPGPVSNVGLSEKHHLLNVTTGVRLQSGPPILVGNNSLAELQRDTEPKMLEDQRKILQELVHAYLNGTENPCSFHDCYCMRNRRCYWCDGEKMMIPSSLGRLGNFLTAKKVCTSKLTTSSQCHDIGCVDDFNDSQFAMYEFYLFPAQLCILFSSIILYSRWRRPPQEKHTPIFASFPRNIDDFAKHTFEGADKIGKLQLQNIFETEDAAGLRGLNDVWTTFSVRGGAVESGTTAFWTTLATQGFAQMLLRSGALTFGLGPYRKMTRVFVALANFQKTIVFVLPIILGFFLVNRLQHFWGVRNKGIALIGKAANIALTAGAILKMSALDGDSLMKQKFVLYRYLMLVIFFTFSCVYESLKAIGCEDLIKAGLLTAQESELLNTSLVGKPAMYVMLLEKWIAEWVVDNVPDSEAVWAKKKLMEEVVEMRTAAVGLIMGVQERALYSFEGLFFSMVNVLCLCYALSVDVTLLDRSKRADFIESFAITQALPTAVLSMFYTTILLMLHKLNHPFKQNQGDLDGLDFEFLLIGTEKKIRDYLTGPRSPASELPAVLKSAAPPLA